MTTSFSIFLIVAEELNISKAAKKSFVTQQCVSDHIKRLEETYKIKLFNRKPKFSLTPAGEIMRNSLIKMKIIEENMEKQLIELKNEVTGEIRFGISSIRARILASKLIKEYKNLYPNVSISFILDDTKNLEKYLLKGEIDLFVGVNTIKNSFFHVEKIGEDNLYFICTENLLKKYLTILELNEIIKNKEIKIEKIKNIPIISSGKKSNASSLIKEFCKYKNIELNEKVYISDIYSSFPMCEEEIGGFFCPTILLNDIENFNKDKLNKLKIFKIKDLNKHLNFDLVYPQIINLPLYVEDFIKLIKLEVNKIYNK